MARKKSRRDFVHDLRDWPEQSTYTRMWTRSPAGGTHPLRLRGAARALPRLILYVILGVIVLAALTAWIDS